MVTSTVESESVRTQKIKAIIRPKNSAPNGLIFGITIATIATLISGALFLLMHHHQPSTESVKTISVPKNSQSQNP